MKLFITIYCDNTSSFFSVSHSLTLLGLSYCQRDEREKNVKIPWKKRVFIVIIRECSCLWLQCDLFKEKREYTFSYMLHPYRYQSININMVRQHTHTHTVIPVIQRTNELHHFFQYSNHFFRSHNDKCNLIVSKRAEKNKGKRNWKTLENICSTLRSKCSTYVFNVSC